MQELFKKRTNIYIGLGVGILGILTLFFGIPFSIIKLLQTIRR